MLSPYPLFRNQFLVSGFCAHGPNVQLAQVRMYMLSVFLLYLKTMHPSSFKSLTRCRSVGLSSRPPRILFTWQFLYEEKKKKKRPVIFRNMILTMSDSSFSSPSYPKKRVICNHSLFLYFCEYHFSLVYIIINAILTVRDFSTRNKFCCG